ncbi:hypothetical protein MCHI_002944 [Candidatus Magnetoovum chiemensis]|nr:hypothetical protein MCHI_002944 [Candidatus Magnetoovum chiemensis]
MSGQERLSAVNKRLALLLTLLVLLISVAVYLPTLYSGFIWDDKQFLMRPLSMGKNPFKIFFGWKFYYRPFIHMFNNLDYAIWGFNALGWHLTNIFINMFNCLLVFLFSHTMLNDDKFKDSISDINERKTLLLSFACAIIFALHPIHVESVAWVSGRTDLLATLFFIPVFLSYYLYTKNGSVLNLFLTVLFLLFSLFSKENALSFLLIAIAYGVTAGIAKRRFVYSIVILAFVEVMYFIVLRRGGGVKELMRAGGSQGAFLSEPMPVIDYIKNLFFGIAYYFEKITIPFNQSLMPNMPSSYFNVIILLIPIILFFLFLRKRLMMEAFLILWIILTLSPSLLVLFSQMTSPLGERYLYLPSVGFSLLLVFLALRIRSNRIIIIVLLIVITLYAVGVVNRVKVWKSGSTLWADTVKKNPSSVTAHINYASALLYDKEIKKAKSVLFNGITLRQNSNLETGMIFYLLSEVAFEENDYDKVEEYLLASIKLDPYNASSYHGLGMVYTIKYHKDKAEGKGNIEYLRTAVENFERALVLSPNFIQARYNLGICYFEMMQFDKAQEYLRTVIERDPYGKYSDKTKDLLSIIDALKKKMATQ